MKKVKNILSISFIVLVVILAILVNNNRLQMIPQGYTTVSQAALDSLDSAANKPPIIDTVYKEKIIKEDHIITKPVLVYKDDSTKVYYDSLKTNDFFIEIIDSIQYNMIISRQWNYTIKAKVPTITIIKPSPILIHDKCPPLKRKSKLALYYGGSILHGRDNNFIMGSLSLLRDESMFTFNLGIGMSINNNISPVIGLGFQKKF